MGLTFEFIHNGEVLATSNELQQASNEKPESEIIISGDEDFKNKMFDAFEELISTRSGASLLNEVFDKLKEKQIKILIYQYKESEVNKGNNSLLLMSFNINEDLLDENNGQGDHPLAASPTTNLAHELSHIRDRLLSGEEREDGLVMDKEDKKWIWSNDNSHWTNENSESEDGSFYLVPYKELLAVEVENLIRKELYKNQEKGLLWLRTVYPESERYNKAVEKYKLRLLLPRTHYSGVNVYNKTKDREVHIKDSKGKYLKSTIPAKANGKGKYIRIPDKEYADSFDGSEITRSTVKTIPFYYLKDAKEPNITLKSNHLIKLDNASIGTLKSILVNTTIKELVSKTDISALSKNKVTMIVKRKK